VIVGLGTDLVEIARLEQALERTPTLRERLFTPSEATLSVASLAGRFAAKEALAKALGAPAGLSWQDAEVVVEESGQPRFALQGTVAAAVVRLGADGVHLSLSHDGGFALAFVVLESAAR
jgi:holo-[acyl-carrier protein] synthase